MALEFTPEEQLQLELLLSKREKATGMPQAKPPKVGSGGAMTDASKRQRDDHGDEPTFSPESPSESYSSEMVEIVFPNGITSLEQWGKVVITIWRLGKARRSLLPRLLHWPMMMRRCVSI